jgi:hypothetical protein
MCMGAAMATKAYNMHMHKHMCALTWTTVCFVLSFQNDKVHVNRCIYVLYVCMNMRKHMCALT